jgi:succinylglutamate desuccinylase
LKPKEIKLFDFVEGRSVRIKREIAAIKGAKPGPNMVFIGGMHGNEPTGVLALHRVMRKLETLTPLISGSVYALVGNLTALEKGERFIVNDLNRIWQADMVEKARKKDYHPTEMINEVEEQIELWSYIDSLMGQSQEKFYFVDLHTTSVKSEPFIFMSDTLMNRSFIKRMPVPVVIGIEEYLNEPLLSYVNELGFPSLAFEGGQHTDPESVRNHEAMIWLSLVNGGLMKRVEVPKYKKYYHQLFHATEGNKKVYEIRRRQGLEPTDEFKMNAGFENFQKLKKGQPLATLNGKVLKAHENAQIFMPLYQAKGDDGFFVIKKIARFWLGVSYVFRRLNLYRFLSLLPGVRRFMDSPNVMVVNRNVAKWYSVELLHLMGYRRKKEQDNLTLFIRRKYDLRGPWSRKKSR